MAVLVKKDVVKIFSQLTGINMEESKPVVDFVLFAVRRLIEEMYPGDTLQVRGFGTFDVSKYNSRPHVMPWIDREINSAAHRKVKFNPGNAIKDEFRALYPKVKRRKQK